MTKFYVNQSAIVFSQVIADVNGSLCRDTETSGSFMTLPCVLFDIQKASNMGSGRTPGG